MKIFISWSGTLSKNIATSLRDWLPNVIQSVEPFMSAEDIIKGQRGLDRIAQELQDSSFGLVCVTRENATAPWINFEAGAIAKHTQSSNVVPLLIDLVGSDLIQSPLPQFQYATFTHDEILAVLKSVNAANRENPLSSQQLEAAFEVWWPDLQKKVETAKSNCPTEPRDTPTPEMSAINELLENSRGHARDWAQANKVLQAVRQFADVHFKSSMLNTNFNTPQFSSNGYSAIVPVGPHAGSGAIHVAAVTAASENLFPTDNSITYRLENAPTGMEIDGATGHVRWNINDIPTVEGNFIASVTATNSGTPQRSTTVDLNVVVKKRAT